MPVVTENLPLQSAVVKYSAQSTFGTPVTPATSTGIARAGYRKLAAVSRWRGPGSPNLVAVKQGATHHEWALRYDAAQSGVKTLLQKALRSGGALPFITLGIGYEDDTTPTSNKWANQIRDCVINQMELSFDAFAAVAPLGASLSGMGTASAEITSLTKGTLTSTPWVSAECVCTKGGSAYRVGAFQFSVNHSVSLDYSAPGAAPSEKFIPSFMTAHDEVIRGSLTRYDKLGHNVHADTPPGVALQLVFTNVDDAANLTLALTDVTFDNESHEQTDQGLRWSADWEAKSWNLT